jgi:hypothetical protein
MPIAQKRRWNLFVDEAIAGVLEGKWCFYIELGIYDTINIEVARSPSGQPYLKSELDRDAPDQLLALPQCR